MSQSAKTKLSSLRTERTRKIAAALLHGAGAKAASAPSPVPALALAALSLAIAALENYAYMALAPAMEDAGSFGLFPFVAVPLVSGMLYGERAKTPCILTALAIWAFSGFAPVSLFVAAIPAVLLAGSAEGLRTVREIWNAAAKVTLVQLLAVSAFLLSNRICGIPEDAPGLYELLFMLLYCAVGVPLAIFTFLPAAERISGRASAYTLAAYGNGSNRLLVRLSREAPGTYHHSMMVADLAESAAEAIGANALLARVGGYFHDIGKIVKPSWFMENQSGGTNPHDSMPPSLSRMVISGHVKDGVAIAREEGLPLQVRGIIESHHGTGVMQWFRLKAQSIAKERGRDSGWGDEAQVKSFFRYPGPLPRTKEEALVSLADSVEAASRSLSAHDRQTIGKLVDGIVMERFADGQLDGCELGFSEMVKVKAAFVRQLVHRFHDRKAYPPRDENSCAR